VLLLALAVLRQDELRITETSEVLPLLIEAQRLLANPVSLFSCSGLAVSSGADGELALWLEALRCRLLSRMSSAFRLSLREASASEADKAQLKMKAIECGKAAVARSRLLPPGLFRALRGSLACLLNSAYRCAEQLDDALAMADEAVGLFRATQHVKRQQWALSECARIHLLRQHFDKAQATLSDMRALLSPSSAFACNATTYHRFEFRLRQERLFTPRDLFVHEPACVLQLLGEVEYHLWQAILLRKNHPAGCHCRLDWLDYSHQWLLKTKARQGHHAHAQGADGAGGSAQATGHTPGVSSDAIAAAAAASAQRPNTPSSYFSGVDASPYGTSPPAAAGVVGEQVQPDPTACSLEHEPFVSGSRS